MFHRSMLVPALIVCAAMPALAQTRAPKEPRPDPMQVVQDLASKVEAAIDKQDAAAWGDVLAPSVVVLPAANPVTPGGVVHGRADAEKLFQGMFKAGVQHATIKVLEAHLIGRSGIWSVGEIHITGARPIDARFGQVLGRSRGTWKVRMMAVSGDLPPGAPGAAPPTR